MVCRLHEKEVNNQPQKSKWSKTKSHCQNFSQWFETRSMQEDVPDLMKQLSRRPNSVARRYSGYLINVYRFHVRKRRSRRKTQNGSVTVVASITSFASTKDKNPISSDLTYYVGPSIPKDNGEVRLTRIDLPEIVIDVPMEEFIAHKLEDEYKEEFEHESTH
ncbi:hypothetical protein EJD97_009454 [Solanum chilense]|uniref:Uncharacterized protein n=1 Tax=Solanum chilense TaxID=4083 RepID=A0A6N2ANE3_SOLCI|nr:hypothetical protein EJD97_009454 [Solanum chilense]